MKSIVVVTHGGAGANKNFADGPQRAALRGAALLESGGTALAAVLAATCELEDDPRFNAGTGSNLRLDGRIIEMDAAVMTSDGRSGAVANLRGVKNPVLVAADVRARTPHLLLSGEGALLFARRLGFAPYDPVTDKAREKLAWARRGLRGLEHDDEEFGKWRDVDLAAIWNYEAPVDECLGDTVGAVARDQHGNFAAAASTGGTLVMLRGRIGDTPLIGCGLYAGPAGAVTATGVGEEIVRRFVSKSVYDAMAAGVEPQAACAQALAGFPPEYGVGIIAIGREGGGVIVANRDMPAGLVRRTVS